jgi:hypothetical protein
LRKYVAFGEDMSNWMAKGVGEAGTVGPFEPLDEILYFDNFDYGLKGWTPLVGNYVDDLDRMHPGYRQITTPMISNLSFWDTGTHGGYTGNYALKIATRPKAGAQNVAIKRVTYHRWAEIQFEALFAFKPEASREGLLDTAVRSVGILFDLQNDKNRLMPHIRYLNAFEGKRIEKWQIKDTPVPIERLSDDTVTHYHLAETNWRDLCAEPQQLCYNEIPTKVNWHKIKIGFDVVTARYTHFSCNDVEYDMSNERALTLPAMPNLRGLLNVALFVESDTDIRSTLYVDSIMLSARR